MKRLAFQCLIFIFSVSIIVDTHAVDIPLVGTEFKLNTSPPMHSIQAVPRESTWWQKRYNEKILQAKESKIDLLMLGDSISHGWEKKGASVWSEFYQSRNAFNLGFSGDRTEHVLWRLRNGAVDNIQPKLTVLMIGTNNTGQRMDPAEHTAQGIKAIISELKIRLPHSKVLLLGVFPRQYSPHNEMRIRNKEINHLIENFKDEDHVYYLNINNIFLRDDNVMNKELMPDLLHPNKLGYQRWAEAIEPMINQLMR